MIHFDFEDRYQDELVVGSAITRREGIAYAVVAHVLILAALFIWKNSVPFVPPREDQLARERGDWVEGKDSTAGFAK